MDEDQAKIPTKVLKKETEGMKDARKLGDVIRSAREKIGYSLRQIEEKAGISNAYLSQLESGRIKSPSPKTLHSLANTLSSSYGELMTAAGYELPTGSTEKNSFTKDDLRQIKSVLEIIQSKLVGQV